MTNLGLKDFAANKLPFQLIIPIHSKRFNKKENLRIFGIHSGCGAAR